MHIIQIFTANVSKGVNVLSVLYAITYKPLYYE